MTREAPPTPAVAPKRSKRWRVSHADYLEREARRRARAAVRPMTPKVPR